MKNLPPEILLSYFNAAGIMGLTGSFYASFPTMPILAALFVAGHFQMIVSLFLVYFDNRASKVSSAIALIVNFFGLFWTSTLVNLSIGITQDNTAVQNVSDSIYFTIIT